MCGSASGNDSMLPLGRHERAKASKELSTSQKAEKNAKTPSNKFQQEKRARGTGNKTDGQISSGSRADKDIVLGIPVPLPSPLLEGEEVTYAIPMQDEVVSLACFTTLSGRKADDRSLRRLTTYDDFWWEELPLEIQAAAEVLGYDQNSWDNVIPVYTEELFWDELTEEQQAAAKLLGYTQALWDGTSTDDTTNTDDGTTMPATQAPGFEAGLVGDVDLAFYDAESGELLCVSAGVDSNEECFELIDPDESILVTVAAYMNSSDVVLQCNQRSVGELTLGEDIFVTFDVRERIYFSYEPDGPESIVCTTNSAGEGDIDLVMFSRDSNRESFSLCESFGAASAEACTAIAIPGATTFVLLTPEFGAIPQEDVVLYCEASPLEDLALGEPIDITIDTPGLAGAVALSFSLNQSSSLFCRTLAAAGYEGDVDMIMYSMDAICESRGIDSSESCTITVKEASTVIVEFSLFSGDPADGNDLTITCYAGPVAELELGNSATMDVQLGDMHTFYLEVGETPAQIMCQVSAASVFLDMTFDDDLIDSRGCGNEFGIPCHLGVFFDDVPIRVRVFGLFEGTMEAVSLDCANEIKEAEILELGIPLSLTADNEEAFFYQFTVEDALSDIICETIVLEGNETDLDIALSPVGVGFQKVLSLSDFGSTNTLIWPWSVPSTTFHLLIEEFDSTKTVMVQCDTIPLDQLYPGEPVTFSSNELSGDRKPYFLAGDSDFGFHLDVADLKVFYMEDVADTVLNCTLLVGEDVAADLYIREVAENGNMEASCYSSFDCLVVTGNATKYLFVAAVATNITGGLDDGMILTCNALEPGDAPGNGMDEPGEPFPIDGSVIDDDEQVVQMEEEEEEEEEGMEPVDPSPTEGSVIDDADQEVVVGQVAEEIGSGDETFGAPYEGSGDEMTEVRRHGDTDPYILH
ncbi:expressed unknown protein [Seminavis robusta]|uniref:Uncharacterized protein n=1 Tax=Seminavis robusta TaxID=568900 RepID=A0A9N8EXE1_9STRA|nr:expressed unknown protein [Seminavis robusta]|eukprot:Sro2668_g334230.1 n/a (922) ;mRNA; r:8440-11205